jgi:hypothetical protein
MVSSDSLCMEFKKQHEKKKEKKKGEGGILLK